jgi:hypothetical protein
MMVDGNLGTRKELNALHALFLLLEKTEMKFFSLSELGRSRDSWVHL